MIIAIEASIEWLNTAFDFKQTFLVDFRRLMQNKYHY